MISGIWVPLVTPFRDGVLDLDSLGRLTETLLDQGVDGFVALGTTGEPASLTRAERLAVLSTVVEASSHRRPVFAGVGGVNTQQVCDDVKAYRTMHVDGLLASAPYYLCPSDDGLVWHFEQIAKAAAALPVMLYNVPKRTGTNMGAPVVERLARLPNITSIKECAAANFGWLATTSLSLMTGDDGALLDCMTLGGCGGVMVSAHLFAPRLVEVARLMARGERDAAGAAFEPLREPIAQLFSQPNPSRVKAVLAARGLIRNELRLPMTRAVPSAPDALDRYLLQASRQESSTNDFAH